MSERFDGGSPGMPQAPVPKRPGLALEWIVIAVSGAIASATIMGEMLTVPEVETAQPTLFGCLGAFVFALGHATWVTIDCKRRGEEVGWWRFAVILLGPLGVWGYLAMTYGVRSLYLIPLSLLVYAAVFVPPLVIIVLMRL